jgi:hypothetical protein
VATVYANGGNFQTAGWTIVDSNVKRLSDSKVQVAVGIEFAAGVTVASAGAEPNPYEAEKNLMLFRLQKLGGGWLVTSVTFAS